MRYAFHPVTIEIKMQMFVRVPSLILCFAAALTSFSVAGCGDGSGLDNVAENMSQAEMDAYMERSAKANQRIADAENPEDPNL